MKRIQVDCLSLHSPFASCCRLVSFVCGRRRLLEIEMRIMCLCANTMKMVRSNKFERLESDEKDEEEEEKVVLCQHNAARQSKWGKHMQNSAVKRRKMQKMTKKGWRVKVFDSAKKNGKRKQFHIEMKPSNRKKNSRLWKNISEEKRRIQNLTQNNVVTKTRVDTAILIVCMNRRLNHHLFTNSMSLININWTQPITKCKRFEVKWNAKCARTVMIGDSETLALYTSWVKIGFWSSASFTRMVTVVTELKLGLPWSCQIWWRTQKKHHEWITCRRTKKEKDAYRSLNLNFEFTNAVIVVERLVYNQNSFDWIGQDERIVFVASLPRNETSKRKRRSSNRTHSLHTVMIMYWPQSSRWDPNWRYSVCHDRSHECLEIWSIQPELTAMSQNSSNVRNFDYQTQFVDRD